MLNEASDDWTEDTLCDVRECILPAFARCEGRWHCVSHIEDLLDRWQAIEIAPQLRELLEPIAYR